MPVEVMSATHHARTERIRPVVAHLSATGPAVAADGDSTPAAAPAPAPA